MTLGEYRVGLTFNPSGDERVTKIKRAAADLIDYLEEQKTPGFGEQIRLCALAQTDVETAAMHGVKAVTKQPRE